MTPIERSARIKSEIFKAGYSLNGLDREYDLPRNTIANTLREPNEAGEKAIAETLKTPAHELFPERYDEDGKRLSPQPQENYVGFPTMAERRKAAEG